MNSGGGKSHGISVNMRRRIDITGVEEVVSFDDQCVVLKTSCGGMTIEGAELKMSTLDTEKGIVALDGRIDALLYSRMGDDKRQGFFGRLRG